MALTLHRNGVPSSVLADMYDVAKRTIYRIIGRPDAPTHDVVIGGWRARFEVTDLGPVQVEPWRPIEADA